MSAPGDDLTTPYRQIAADLRRKIVSGELGPEAKLPSARELMEAYGVATQTVQNAFRLLRAEELIYSVQGRGTFVRGDIDPEALPGGEAPSPEYLRVLEQLSAITDEVHQLEERVSQLEGKPKRAR